MQHATYMQQRLNAASRLRLRRPYRGEKHEQHEPVIVRGPQPRTVEITADEACHIRAAIASDMKKTSKIVREHLKNYEATSSVALWIESLTCQAALLEKIDPPGWRKPFPKAA